VYPPSRLDFACDNSPRAGLQLVNSSITCACAVAATFLANRLQICKGHSLVQLLLRAASAIPVSFIRASPAFLLVRRRLSCLQLLVLNHAKCARTCQGLNRLYIVPTLPRNRARPVELWISCMNLEKHCIMVLWVDALMRSNKLSAQ